MSNEIGSTKNGFSAQDKGIAAAAACHTLHLDELTGLPTRRSFCASLEGHNSPELAIFFFDLIKFKAINDIFGFSVGDGLLVHIGKALSENESVVLATRESADRFAFLAKVREGEEAGLAEAVTAAINEYDIPFEININFGVYRMTGSAEPGNSLLDKAVLAQSVVKGSYTNKVNIYTEKLRSEMLSEQEIIGSMNEAIEKKQFIIHYQPQYNHSTGMLVGAEALVRWRSGEGKLISPGIFIPIFEKNGFITRLDFYVFEEVAAFQRRSIDNGYSVVPISVNFSKHDIYSQGFIERLEEIRERYSLPAKYLRIEITESVLSGNTRFVNDILKRLHALGYIIEMDDFGSGYSSLNVLKDLDFDIIKLDMMFLADSDERHRGGTVLSSVINMARWLRIPVIAEGVETVEQADFLRSIGCEYIQGYLYSRPVPEEDYIKLISGSHIGALVPEMDFIKTINTYNFWDPTSLETLIFSNFVGGASIFSYDKATGRVEILRVNKKYLRELGMNLSEKDIIHSNPADTLDNANKDVYISTLNRAIESEDEEECETWRTIVSECCGEERICVRSTVRMIGKSGSLYLFYGMIRNITTEKYYYNDLSENARNFKVVAEQANLYFWEYVFATKEMRPCFRCMRDLNLPPLLRNYPESAFERGIFPPEVSELYYGILARLEAGEKSIEAIVPLTLDRIPFKVRYTTEFDENGKPVKAYGSAEAI